VECKYRTDKEDYETKVQCKACLIKRKPQICIISNNCLSLMQLRVSDCLICRTAHYYFDVTLNLNSDCFGFLTRTNLNKQLQQTITNNYNKQLQTITSIKYIIYFVMNPISINSDQLQLPFCAPSSLDQKEQSSHESGYSI
jgi:hypothetical protein